MAVNMVNFKDIASKLQIQTDIKAYTNTVFSRNKIASGVFSYFLWIFLYTVILAAVIATSKTVVSGALNNFLDTYFNFLLPEKLINIILLFIIWIIVSAIFQSSVDKEIKNLFRGLLHPLAHFLVFLVLAITVCVLPGHVLYFFTPILVFLLGIYVFLLFSILPISYLRLLSKYSLVLFVHELSKMRQCLKNKDLRNYKKNKIRAEFYLYSFILRTSGEKEFGEFSALILKKFYQIEKNEMERMKNVDNYYAWLKDVFSFSSSNISGVLKYQEDQSVITKIADFFDGLFILSMHVRTFNSKLYELWTKALTPIQNKTLDIPLMGDVLNVKKSLRTHLSIAQEYDIISARQKIDMFFAVNIAYLFSVWITYMLNFFGEDFVFFSKEGLYLPLRFFSSVLLSLFTGLGIEFKFRKSGLDIWLSKSFYVYIYTFIFLSAFSLTSNFNIDVLLAAISPYIEIISWLIVVIELLFLFLYFRPPVELRKTEVAKSLLLRELLVLYNLILKIAGNSSRRSLSLNIYYIKSYFRLTLKGLISNYDSREHKNKFEKFLLSIESFLDNLSFKLKLGNSEGQGEVLSNLEILIISVLQDNFGDIPKRIPEAQHYFDFSSVQVKTRTFAGKILQLLDTSYVARLVTAVLLVILINFLNPSLWEHIQNFSSVFGLFSP